MHAAEGIRAGPSRPATWGMVEQVLQNTPLACLQTVQRQTCHTYWPLQVGRTSCHSAVAKGQKVRVPQVKGNRIQVSSKAALFTRHSTGWSVEIAPWSPGFIHNEARETTGPLSVRQLGGSLSVSNEISPHHTTLTGGRGGGSIGQSFHLKVIYQIRY